MSPNRRNLVSTTVRDPLRPSYVCGAGSTIDGSGRLWHARASQTHPDDFQTFTYAIELERIPRQARTNC